MQAKINQFLKADNHIINLDDISSIDLSDLETKCEVRVITKTGLSIIATELNAIELVMQTRPSALEGRRLRWAKHVWYIHNLIGHPLMQFLAMLKLYKWAFWIHDVTVPKPLGFKK